MSKIHECVYCKKTFRQSQGLSRHKKTCKKQKNSEQEYTTMEKIMEEFIGMKAKINMLEKTNEQLLKDKINMLERNEVYLKSLVNEAGSLTKTSVNALSYITKKFTNAPILQALEEKDYSNLQPENETNLVDVLIYYYKQGLIAKYFGDFLVKMYKTDKPEEQSLWSSDVARLNYIIRTVTYNNKQSTIWLADKNGIKINDTIIIPMLNHINEKIILYNKEKSKTMANCQSTEIVTLLNKISTAVEISNDIDNGIIAKDIIKYIAPHFSIDCTMLT